MRSVDDAAGALAPETLAARVEAVLAGKIEELRPLPGGASSHTFRARFVGASDATSSIVIKVAPPGLEPIRNRDVLRQARLLRTLGIASAVPVPVVLGEDPGSPPAVPPLFAMSFVPGDSLEPLFDVPARAVSTPPPVVDVAGRAGAAVNALADLHAVSLSHPLLRGEVALPLVDEVDRWIAALGSVDPPYATDWPKCAEELLTSVPGSLAPVVSHGDFRLGNMLATGPTLAAIIDWEIWAISDPRIDVAWFRLNADPDVYRRRTPYTALLPSPDEILRSYRGPAAVVRDLQWFDALARFKAIAIWSLILKRQRRTGTETFADVASALPRLLRAARALLR